MDQLEATAKALDMVFSALERPRTRIEVTRDFLAEAYGIAQGRLFLTPQREHLVALYQQLHPAEDKNLVIT
jgi:hypothetical protein